MSHLRRQLKLGFCLRQVSSFVLTLFHQPQIIPLPQRTHEHGSQHSHTDSKKGEPDLVEGKAMVVLKNDGKGTKEEIKDTEELQ